VPPASHSAFSTPDALPPLGPSTIFERANAARHNGNMAEARALYRQLQTQYPRSSEALLSLATLARVDLDHGQAASALSGFEAYLASGDGALREQALSGRATALWRMGRRAEEIEAWRVLLAAYPGSAYGTIARERLDPDAQ
jgi:outer membrane protein assembly factor BamD (BamD/ComL family)